MKEKDLIIRNEIISDYDEVEKMVRSSFLNIYREGALEHYLLHMIRNDKSFIKELDFVLLKNNEIIGQIVFAKSFIKTNDNKQIEVATFGPLCIRNEYKRKGYGKYLLDYSMNKAKELGIKALFIEGNYNFYKHCGFEISKNIGIIYEDDPDANYFLVKELEKGFLSNIKGTYKDPDIYLKACNDEKGSLEFDKKFVN